MWNESKEDGGGGREGTQCKAGFNKEQNNFVNLNLAKFECFCLHDKMKQATLTKTDMKKKLLGKSLERYVSTLFRRDYRQAVIYVVCWSFLLRNIFRRIINYI